MDGSYTSISANTNFDEKVNLRFFNKIRMRFSKIKNHLFQLRNNFQIEYKLKFRMFYQNDRVSSNFEESSLDKITLCSDNLTNELLFLYKSNDFKQMLKSLSNISILTEDNIILIITIQNYLIMAYSPYFFEFELFTLA